MGTQRIVVSPNTYNDLERGNMVQGDFGMATRDVKAQNETEAQVVKVTNNKNKKQLDAKVWQSGEANIVFLRLVERKQENKQAVGAANKRKR